MYSSFVEIVSANAAVVVVAQVDTVRSLLVAIAPALQTETANIADDIPATDPVTGPLIDGAADPATKAAAALVHLKVFPHLHLSLW